MTGMTSSSTGADVCICCVAVPVSSTATLLLPTYGADIVTVVESGVPIYSNARGADVDATAASGVRQAYAMDHNSAFADGTGDRIAVVIGSGTYAFQLHATQ
jgi:hypothetical protein